MKNIITILLILIVPICAYLFMSKNSENVIAFANGKNIPTIMTFSSTMCLDCQKLKVVIKDVEQSYGEKVNFVNYNALDKDRKVKENIKKYGVVLAPTIVILDKNGNKIKKIEGYIPKEELIKEVEEVING